MQLSPETEHLMLVARRYARAVLSQTSSEATFYNELAAGIEKLVRAAAKPAPAPSTRRVARWVEPWKGHATDGSVIDVPVANEASLEGCVAIERLTLSVIHELKGDESAEFLLSQFVARHHASLETAP